jgi:hypothetical protein
VASAESTCGAVVVRADGCMCSWQPGAREKIMWTDNGSSISVIGLSFHISAAMYVQVVDVQVVLDIECPCESRASRGTEALAETSLRASEKLLRVTPL